mmetsp:Transcript_4733/g.8093  ORF Transcript_4733/g.8093 Transcript_4733/m.8093 type:complete len:83 (-) Transcript_4733:1311-1559(-)
MQELKRRIEKPWFKMSEYVDNLPYIKFQVEVNYFDSDTDKARRLRRDFSVADIDFETDPLFPRLDITRFISVVGDYYSDRPG